MEQIKPVGGRAVYSPPSRSSNQASVANASQSVKNVAPQFVSPKGSIDPQSGVFVTEVRDTGTGQVTFQYPSKKAVAAYARTSRPEQVQSAPKQSNANEGSGESQPKVESSAPAPAPTSNSASADAVTVGATGQGER
jgi:hypothetical protein